MNKINNYRLRKIHRVLLYSVFATVGYMFFAMMPEAQKYLNQEYLEGKERINRDKVVWPVNPKKIPRSIRVLWSLSSLGIAALACFIGMILVSNEGILFAICATLLFVYAFFMLGIGIYQLKKAVARDDGMRHF